MMETVWPLLQSLQGFPAYALLLGLLPAGSVVLVATEAAAVRGVLLRLPSGRTH